MIFSLRQDIHLKQKKRGAKITTLQCTPSDLLGKALDYAYKLWPRLRRYTLDGNYQIDTTRSNDIKDLRL